MSSKPPSPLKTTARAATGGVALVGAILLLMFFRGTGVGIGTDGEGENDKGNSSETPETESKDPNPSPELASMGNPSPDPFATSPTEPEAAAEPEEPELSRDEQVATGQKTLGILIDERSYLLKIPGTPQDVFRPSTLERVVELAQMVPGDSNGIRVTVLRRETARTTAEQQLKQALAATGITDDAIYMPSDFVP